MLRSLATKNYSPSLIVKVKAEAERRRRRAEKDRLERERYLKFRVNPHAYAQEILGVEWWSKQIEVAEALLTHRKVFVKASHSVGKTFLAGSLVNWFFDCYSPSKTLTTAPNQQQAIEVTWGEVRAQRKTNGLMPKAPRIEGFSLDGSLDPAHFAAYSKKKFLGDSDRVAFLFELYQQLASPLEAKKNMRRKLD